MTRGVFPHAEPRRAERTAYETTPSARQGHPTCSRAFPYQHACARPLQQPLCDGAGGPEQVPVAVRAPRTGTEHIVCWIDSKATFGDHRMHLKQVDEQYKTYINR